MKLQVLSKWRSNGVPRQKGLKEGDGDSDKHHASISEDYFWSIALNTILDIKLLLVVGSRNLFLPKDTRLTLTKDKFNIRLAFCIIN